MKFSLTRFIAIASALLGVACRDNPEFTTQPDLKPRTSRVGATYDAAGVPDRRSAAQGQEYETMTDEQLFSKGAKSAQTFFVGFKNPGSSRGFYMGRSFVSEARVDESFRELTQISG
ncbi:MAG: hypothetical protein ACO1Q7_04730 [Gemmatimonas sp.]